MTVTVGNFSFVRDGQQETQPLTLDINASQVSSDYSVRYNSVSEFLAESNYNECLTNTWMELQDEGCSDIEYSEVHPLPYIF